MSKFIPILIFWLIGNFAFAATNHNYDVSAIYPDKIKLHSNFGSACSPEKIKEDVIALLDTKNFGIKTYTETGIEIDSLNLSYFSGGSITGFTGKVELESVVHQLASDSSSNIYTILHLKGDYDSGYIIVRFKNDTGEGYTVSKSDFKRINGIEDEITGLAIDEKNAIYIQTLSEDRKKMSIYEYTFGNYNPTIKLENHSPSIGYKFEKSIGVPSKPSISNGSSNLSTILFITSKEQGDFFNINLFSLEYQKPGILKVIENPDDQYDGNADIPKLIGVSYSREYLVGSTTDNVYIYQGLGTGGFNNSADTFTLTEYILQTSGVAGIGLLAERKKHERKSFQYVPLRTHCDNFFGFSDTKPNEQSAHYFSDSTRSEAIKLSTDNNGLVLNEWPFYDDESFGYLFDIDIISNNSTKRVVVIDTGNKSIFLLDYNTLEIIRKLTLKDFQLPMTITSLGDHGEFIVADPFSRMLYKFNFHGDLVRQITTNDQILGIAYLNGEIHALERVENHHITFLKKIIRYDSSLTMIGSYEISSSNIGNIELNMESDGSDIFLTGPGTVPCRIDITNSSCAKIVNESLFEYPKDIDFDRNGNSTAYFLTSDNFSSTNTTLKNFATGVNIINFNTGVISSKIGSYGSLSDQFNYPDALAVSSDGKDIFVTDTGNRRVVKYKKSEGNKNNKALIIAGNHDKSDELFEEMNELVDSVYVNLNQRGFSASDIYYLGSNANSLGIYKGDYPDQFFEAGNSTLNGILQNIKGNSEASEDLIIYLLGHSTDNAGTVQLSNQTITPEYLTKILRERGYLSNVILVVEACDSGEYLDFITSTSAAPSPFKAIVTSSDKTHDATIGDGGHSFSRTFFNSIGNQKTLEAAFNIAKIPFEKQYPGFVISPSIETPVTIGSSKDNNINEPRIVSSVITDSSISGTTSFNLVLSSNVSVEQVYGVVTTSQQERGSNEPFISPPKIKMNFNSTYSPSRYEGTLESVQNGFYTISFYAHTADGREYYLGKEIQAKGKVNKFLILDGNGSEGNISKTIVSELNGLLDDKDYQFKYPADLAKFPNEIGSFDASSTTDNLVISIHAEAYQAGSITFSNDKFLLIEDLVDYLNTIPYDIKATLLYSGGSSNKFSVDLQSKLTKKITIISEDGSDFMSLLWSNIATGYNLGKSYYLAFESSYFTFDSNVSIRVSVLNGGSQPNEGELISQLSDIYLLKTDYQDTSPSIKRISVNGTTGLIDIVVEAQRAVEKTEVTLYTIDGSLRFKIIEASSCINSGTETICQVDASKFTSAVSAFKIQAEVIDSANFSGSNTLLYSTNSDQADSYEPDNTLDTATKLAINGYGQYHNFQPNDTTDYMTFRAQAGNKYRIEVVSGNHETEGESVTGASIIKVSSTGAQSNLGTLEKHPYDEHKFFYDLDVPEGTEHFDVYIKVEGQNISGNQNGYFIVLFNPNVGEPTNYCVKLKEKGGQNIVWENQDLKLTYSNGTVDRMRYDKGHFTVSVNLDSDEVDTKLVLIKDNLPPVEIASFTLDRGESNCAPDEISSFIVNLISDEINPDNIQVTITPSSNANYPIDDLPKVVHLFKLSIQSPQEQAITLDKITLKSEQLNLQKFSFVLSLLGSFGEPVRHSVTTNGDIELIFNEPVKINANSNTTFDLKLSLDTK